MRYVCKKDWLPKQKSHSEYKNYKDSLRTLYDGCCVYCDENFESSSYGQVEHFYPKKRFPAHKSAPENLHFCCQICNGKKGQKTFALSANYLAKDPNGKAPVQWIHTKEDLLLESIPYKYFFVASNCKASKKIVKDLNLNGEPTKNQHRRITLLEKRIEKYWLIQSKIALLVDVLSKYSKKSKMDVLEEKTVNLILSQILDSTKATASFAPMIIQNFGEDILSIMEIYHELKSS